jgi:hypothetical protein
MNAAEPAPSPSPTALDLGSGPEPAPGFVGVDLCAAGAEGASVVFVDLFSGAPWPFPSESVTRLRASHVIEHIPPGRVIVGVTRVRRTVRSHIFSADEPMPPSPRVVTHFETIPRSQEAFFWFFDEAFRIAAPGCRFELAWPHPQSDGADQDPTHCRRIPVSMLHYLSRSGRRAMRVEHYPVECDWHIEPGSVQELATDETLAPFTRADGSIDFASAKRCHGVFHEIRAALVKPPSHE